MARSLPHTLNLTRRLSPKSGSFPTPLPSHRILALRTQSSHSSSCHNNFLADISDPSESAPSSSDPLLRRLEDAIHRIIVRRSAPDWLPFVPGSSYWVPPPRSRSHGIAQLVEKLVDPLTEEESMSTTTVRGWPSSAYFIQGAPSPHPVEGETTINKTSRPQSEDEEG